MPLIPVVVVPHSGGAPLWEAAAAQVGDALDNHADLSVVLRLPGAALEHVASIDLWRRIDRDRLVFLAGGYTDPILALLPPEAQRLQMDREVTAMGGAGISAGGLWVADAWDPGLVTRAIRSGFRLIFFPADFLDGQAGEPGAIERAGEAVVGIPVTDDVPEPEPEGLVAVRVPAEELHGFVGTHGKRIESVSAHLDRVGPGPRLTPRLYSPQLTPDRELYYRKLLLLIRDQGSRSGGHEAILELQSRQYLLSGDVRTDTDLLSARVGLERGRGRADSSAHTAVLDWDADGVDEVRIETAQVSLVVDPARSALAYWDDKSGLWPVTAVDPTSPLLLVSRQTVEGGEVLPEPMRVKARSEGRNHAVIELIDDDGAACRLEVGGRTISLDLEIADGDPVLVGPEIPLNLGQARLRSDGGAWRDVTEAMALTGHRFRLTDDTRSFVISSLRPCELFIQPLERGLMLWPHWLTSGGDSYRIQLEPS